LTAGWKVTIAVAQHQDYVAALLVGTTDNKVCFAISVEVPYSHRIRFELQR